MKSINLMYFYGKLNLNYASQICTRYLETQPLLKKNVPILISDSTELIIFQVLNTFYDGKLIYNLNT